MDSAKAHNEVPSSERKADTRIGGGKTAASDPPIEPPDTPKTGFSGMSNVSVTAPQEPHRKPAERP
jgi:hypothetical protein